MFKQIKHICIGCVLVFVYMCVFKYVKRTRVKRPKQSPVSALYGGEYYITVTTKAVKCWMVL